MDRAASLADVGLTQRLLNHWQRDFPLSNRPFAQVGQAQGATETEVIDIFTDALQRGAISRIGGVWAPGVGGAALLCAMAVPVERFEAVVAQVNAHPEVAHNYAREHALACADKPASACLASRLPTGTEVTRERLARVERAERSLAGLGFRVLRVQRG